MFHFSQQSFKLTVGNLHQNIAVRVLQLAFAGQAVDPIGKALMNDVVNAPLDLIELTPMCCLVRFWKLENILSEKLAACH